MKNLIVITESYPYKGGEQFLYNEFIELSKHYQTIYFFPLNKNELAITPPDNYIISDALNSNQPKTTKYYQFIPLILKFIFIELFGNKNSFQLLLKLRYHVASIKKAISNKLILEKEFTDFNIKSTDAFYSTWMNTGALTLSILKKNNNIKDFFFRVNGFDIFEERHKGNYLPFQIVNYKYCKKVIVLSNAGYEHLKNKTKYSHKLFQNYSGQYDIGLNQLTTDSIITVVSCSNLIKLKRVNIIVEALSTCKKRMHWVHFGDGPEMKEIIKLCENLPKHISYDLKGKVSNQEIIEFYKKESVNFFIHTSETEGLGMAIIEAQSFGIPALACAVGGVPEIVNTNTGKPLIQNLTPYILAEELESIIDSKKNKAEFRIQTKLHFNKKFNIKENIKLLIKSIEA